MNHNEIAKELGSLLRIWNSTVMTISLGIIAYSFSNFNKDSLGLVLIFLSWGLLIISFFIAVLRFHHQIAVLTRNAYEQFQVEVNKKEIKIDQKRIISTNKKSAWLYRIMNFTFCVGVILYGVFLALNL